MLTGSCARQSPGSAIELFANCVRGAPVLAGKYAGQTATQLRFSTGQKAALGSACGKAAGTSQPWVR